MECVDIGFTTQNKPHRITCKLNVIEIQLSRLQVYNLHQVWSHLKDVDVILKNRTTFNKVDLFHLLLMMIELNQWYTPKKWSSAAR